MLKSCLLPNPSLTGVRLRRAVQTLDLLVRVCLSALPDRALAAVGRPTPNTRRAHPDWLLGCWQLV